MSTLQKALREHHETARKRTLKILREHPVHLQGGAVAGDAALRTQQFIDQVSERAQPACESGCSWCCRGLQVDVTAPEALFIAKWLETVHSPEDLSLIKEIVSDCAADTRTLDIDTRWLDQTPCVLLDEDNGTCRVYGVRPIACRGMNSCDADDCKQAHLDPATGETAELTRIDSISGLAAAASTGLVRGIRESDRDGDSYELAAALHIALSVPDAATKWAQGQDVFTQARRPCDKREQFEAVADASVRPLRHGGRPSKNERKAKQRQRKAKRRQRSKAKKR